MKKKHVLLIIFCIISNGRLCAQETSKISKSDYLIIQSGLSIDNIGRTEVDIQFLVEYQKEVAKNWFLGVLYEHTRHLGDFVISKVDIDLPIAKSVGNFACMNAYYKIKIPKRKWSITPGIGIGMMFLNRDGHTVSKPIANLSLTLNIPISSRIDLQFLPFVTLGNRIYFSPFQIDTKNNHYFKANLFPIGIKIKL